MQIHLGAEHHVDPLEAAKDVHKQKSKFQLLECVSHHVYRYFDGFYDRGCLDY